MKLLRFKRLAATYKSRTGPERCKYGVGETLLLKGRKVLVHSAFWDGADYRYLVATRDGWVISTVESSLRPYKPR